MAFRAEPYVLDPGNLTDDGPGNLGLALGSGRLVATVVSAKSGKYISVQLQAKRKEGKRFRSCELYEAERIYADVPREGGSTGKEIGCLHLVGKWAAHIMPPWEEDFDRSRLWAMKRVLDVAQDLAAIADDQASILEGQICLMCGRELTDPESIARNIGPTCWERATSSVHAAPQEADVFDDEGSAEDGANGVRSETEVIANDARNADIEKIEVTEAKSYEEATAIYEQRLAAGQVQDPMEFARSIGSEDQATVEGRELTREQIEHELQQVAKDPAREEGPPELDGTPGEVGDLYELGAGDDPRVLLEEVRSRA